MADFDAAIRCQPDFAAAYANRAAIQTTLGHLEAARKDADRAIELDPRSSQAHLARGFIRMQAKQFAEAVKDFDQAIACDSENAWAVAWRGITQAHLGKYALARSELSDAVERFSGAYATHMMWGWFLATCPEGAFRDGQMALREAERAVELSGGDAYALDIRAAAEAETGQFEQALESEREALQRLVGRGADRKSMEARLHLYEEKKAYRDQP